MQLEADFDNENLDHLSETEEPKQLLTDVYQKILCRESAINEKIESSYFKSSGTVNKDIHSMRLMKAIVRANIFTCNAKPAILSKEQLIARLQGVENKSLETLFKEMIAENLLRVNNKTRATEVPESVCSPIYIEEKTTRQRVFSKFQHIKVIAM